MKVWVTLGSTESGDTVGPYVWARRPSEEDLERKLHRDYQEDFEAEAINYRTTEEELLG